MKKYLYLAKWFFCARFLGKKRPLQTVLFITDQCNLQCQHCHVYNNSNPTMKRAAQIEEELRYAYSLGSRFVDFEGGEPMLWRDNELTINDLVAMAKRIGFFSTTITTNAQLPFPNSAADSIWVSLDGVGDYHDRIRGAGAFDKLCQNIAISNHKALSVNMTINSQNYENVIETIEFAKQNPHILSISLNFHTPYSGTEALFLDWSARRKVIDDIIALKRRGYPIMNSVSGLKLMKHNRFEKACWVCNFILPDGTRLPECVGKTAEMCAQCGFCMAGEMRSVFDFKIDTLRAGMKLRV